MEEELPCPDDLVKLSLDDRQDHLFSLEQLLTAVKRLNFPQPRLHLRTGLPNPFASSRINAFQSQRENDGKCM
jgi:hypothetical protein